MRRVFIIALIVATTLGLTTVMRAGAATGAQITGTLAPAPGYSQVIHRNVEFRVGVAATDQATNDYTVSIRMGPYTSDWLTLTRAPTCAGIQPNSPLSEGLWCTYSNVTTTTSTTTHLAAWFIWSAPVGSRFTLRLCAHDTTTLNCRTMHYLTIS